ncbi:MAG: hypothetical protein U0790_01290 [Isosphaeraceae bacterium]
MPYLSSIIFAKNPEIRKNSGIRKLCSQLSIEVLGLPPKPGPNPTPPPMNAIGRW